MVKYRSTAMEEQKTGFQTQTEPHPTELVEGGVSFSPTPGSTCLHNGPLLMLLDRVSTRM